MNSLERMYGVLQGKQIVRSLNFDIMMGFAADHIGKPLSSYYQDYRVLGEANLAVQADFQLDIVQAISDPYREAADAGLEVEFPPDDLPLSKKPLLEVPEDLRKLRFPAPEQGRRMSDRLEAIRYFRHQVGGEIPIMGWVEGALAEAADLRGVINILIDLVDRPAWVFELLEQCVEAEIAFARAQVGAGADIIGLGDAIASQVSPAMYRKVALPYEQRIFSAVKEMGALSRLHICGNTTRILADMAKSGAEIIDLDWMVDLRQARETLPVVICGNLDPVAVFLQGSPEEVEAGTFANAGACAPKWMAGAGCEIPRQTPHANLHAQTRALNKLAVEMSQG
jgi:MtaA/CmuA family methyltransferase